MISTVSTNIINGIYFKILFSTSFWQYALIYIQVIYLKFIFDIIDELNMPKSKVVSVFDVLSTKFNRVILNNLLRLFNVSKCEYTYLYVFFSFILIFNEFKKFEAISLLINLNKHFCKYQNSKFVFIRFYKIIPRFIFTNYCVISMNNSQNKSQIFFILGRLLSTKNPDNYKTRILLIFSSILFDFYQILDFNVG